MTYSNRSLQTLALLGATFTLGHTAAQASLLGYLGTNVTIPDLIHTGSGWYGNHEDQETEPGTVAAQVWDMEGFFLNGTRLSMVGGYDMKHGQLHGGKLYTSGDLFLDVTGDAVYGPPADGSGVGNANTVNNTFGYEYVLQFDMNAMTYTVIQLNPDTVLLKTVSESINQEANPWRYASGGTILTGYENVPFTYMTGLSDADVGLLGGSHNLLAVDLAFLGNANVIAHYTMSCGNDNLMGQFRVQVPDTGSTALLLLGGLLGLGRLRSAWKN